MMLTLSNSGANTVPITDIVSSNAEFVVPNVLDYPLFIEPGNALQVPIRFDPTSLGNKAATISVESGPFQTRAIKVTGKAPPPELDLIIAAGQHPERAPVIAEQNLQPLETERTQTRNITSAELR